MTNLSIELIRIFFSEERLIPYGGTYEDPVSIINKYNENILLCEAMYPALHYFEVLLRNHIDYSICRTYGEDWLINIPPKLQLSSQDKTKINEIKTQVYREKRRLPTHDDIISRLSFGFWCALFHKRFDPVLWHRKNAIKSIFPNLARKYQNRKYIEQRILRIKKIRNRIAHHERIWDGMADTYQLKISYNDCAGLIFAMSREAVYLLNQIDRFPGLYEQITSKNDKETKT